MILVFGIVLISSCKKDNSVSNNTLVDAKLIVKLDVDANQVRLGNLGEAVTIPAGHAGQNPSFNTLSAHYLELAPSATTWLGDGEILYKAPETDTSGEMAIDFDKAKIITPGEVFLEIPIKDIAAGNYEWVRLSLSYQNFDVAFYFNNIPFTGTLASFVGFNNYLTDYTIKNESVSVNENKAQGYWGFETVSEVVTGQAPAGATTVPNPLFDTSPTPQASCAVPGKFDDKLVITGNETEDIEVTLSLSINKSFEWVDTNGNGKWDVTTSGVESVVDMGLRGLVPSYK